MVTFQPAPVPVASVTEKPLNAVLPVVPSAWRFCAAPFRVPAKVPAVIAVEIFNVPGARVADDPAVAGVGPSANATPVNMVKPTMATAQKSATVPLRRMILCFMSAVSLPTPASRSSLPVARQLVDPDGGTPLSGYVPLAPLH